jgi:hypothetical protein|tara:strand:+ start:283 stop:504 length:222 start_codon:yes stop_codon:yes gene_type:complete
MEELNLTLKLENESLKTKNEALFKKTRNQQRTISRLKKIIEKQNSFLRKVKENKIKDDEWDDLELIMKDAEQK